MTVFCAALQQLSPSWTGPRHRPQLRFGAKRLEKNDSAFCTWLLFVVTIAYSLQMSVIIIRCTGKLSRKSVCKLWWMFTADSLASAFCFIFQISSSDLVVHLWRVWFVHVCFSRCCRTPRSQQFNLWVQSWRHRYAFWNRNCFKIREIQCVVCQSCDKTKHDATDSRRTHSAQRKKKTEKGEETLRRTKDN